MECPKEIIILDREDFDELLLVLQGYGVDHVMTMDTKSKRQHIDFLNADGVLVHRMDTGIYAKTEN